MKDIVIENVSKSFEGKKALGSFSAVIPYGSMVCIKGPSGGGKTTLLKIIAGLLKPDTGSVQNVPPKIAFVFQEDRLCEEHTPVGNIKMVTGKTMTRRQIVSHLAELGLENDISEPVKELSGGMKRRVAIARAVCFDADLLILDEPFKGLDSALLKTVVAYIKKHASGKTVIFVTHNENEEELMDCDTVFTVS